MCRNLLVVFLGSIVAVMLCPSSKAQVCSGGALRFDGDDDYVDFGFGPHSEAFCLEAWVKPEARGNDSSAQVVGSVSQPYCSDFGFGLYVSNSVVSFQLAIPGCGNDIGLSYPVRLNEWQHLAGTFDGQTMRLIVDGQEASALVATYASSSRFLMGTQMVYGLPGTEFLKGELDEVRFWRGARTASQIRMTMHESVPSHIDLVANWSFDTGTDQVVADDVGIYNGILGHSSQIDPCDPTRIDSTAPVQDSTSVASYGSGCPGESGHVPALAFLGCPRATEPVGLRILNAKGSSTAFLILGTTPFAGGPCDLLVRNWLLFVSLPLSGLGPGQGYFGVDFIFPDGFPVDTTFAMQAAILDPDGAFGSGVSLSNGVTFSTE